MLQLPAVPSHRPSRDELLRLLQHAKDTLIAQQQHWGAVIGLTGDRRFQRQQQEALRLLDAMRERIERYRDSREASESDALDELIGERINTVSFVMDYVEFGFNGPILRALTNPLVQMGRREFRFPEQGSRDALCSLIDAEVVAVTIEADDRIELALSGTRNTHDPARP